MAYVNYFFAAYLPAVLLAVGVVFFVIGRQYRLPARPLSASVYPRLSIAFRVLFPQGWRRRKSDWRKAGFYLELTGLLLAAAALLTGVIYWIWWIYWRP